MTNDPVQDLIDQLKLMRVELADVKKRQLTEEQLKHLQAALDSNATAIAGVQDAAAQGSQEGASRLMRPISQTAGEIHRTVNDAIHSLSEAHRAASEGVLARRRYVGALMGLSALTGLAMGAFASLLVYDHVQGREFKASVELMGWNWSCTKQGGFIADQENGRFCVFDTGR